MDTARGRFLSSAPQRGGDKGPAGARGQRLVRRQVLPAGWNRSAQQTSAFACAHVSFHNHVSITGGYAGAGATVFPKVAAAMDTKKPSCPSVGVLRCIALSAVGDAGKVIRPAHRRLFQTSQRVDFVP